MIRSSRFAALGLIGLALAPLGARAQSPSVTMASPFYPSATGVPLQSAPYWSTPYWAHPYWSSQPTPYAAQGAPSYHAGGTNLPGQFGSQTYPMPRATRICVAPGITCATSSPTTPGQPCTCPVDQGETVTGFVR